MAIYIQPMETLGEYKWAVGGKMWVIPLQLCFTVLGFGPSFVIWFFLASKEPTTLGVAALAVHGPFL